MIIIDVLVILFVILLGIITLYLIIVIFFPGFTVAKQPLYVLKKAGEDTVKKSPALRENISFEIDGMTLRAWLYLPEHISIPVPCIVMNHGFGGTKDMILEKYAKRFQEAGMSVLTYDYRYFGSSDGQPRQLFSIQSQIEDCTAAVEYIRNRSEINPDKIAIWGTSAGGGYGFALAAHDKEIACICAQVAGLDTKEDGKLALKREGLAFFLRLFMHAQRDKGRSRFGLPEHKIPLVGRPGTLAMIVAPGAYDGYAKLAQPDFVNEVCARAILTSGDYNPVDYAQKVQCPVLIQVCLRDNLVSIDSVKKIATILGQYAEIKRYPIGHFDIYSGNHFEQAVGDQIAFFKKYL